MNKKNILSSDILILVLLSVLNLQAASLDSIGPYGGQFKCIEISKSNPEILYTGTYYGGIFKSNNSGSSWYYLGFRGDTIISSIAIDCDNPDHIYFSWCSIKDYSSGIMGSKDGGLNWEEMLTPARVVATSSKIHNVVFIGNNDGVYISTDGGATFEKIDYQFGLNNISVITTDPLDSSTVYIGTSDAIYKSTNLGKDWIKLRDTYDFSTYPAYVNDISVSELNNNIILVATSHDGLLISDNGGTDWSRKDFGLQVHGVLCDNRGENVLYAAHLGGFMVSSDFGQTFQELKDGRFIDAKNSDGVFYLLEESTGTILKSTDKGQTWTRLINGISNISVNSLLINDKNDAELLSIVNAGYDKTLLKYSNASWDTILASSVGNRLFMDQSNQHVFMLGGGAFAKCKDDQYETWENCGSGLPYCNPGDLAINGDTLYITCTTAFEGLDAGIYKSVDEGSSWFLSSNGLPLVERQYLGTSKFAPVDIYSICTVKNNPKYLYAGGYENLFRSTDSGANWSEVFTFDQCLISKIVSDPDSLNIIYLIAGYSYHNLPNTLYKSSNNGESFIEIDCGLEQVYCIFFDSPENILYVGGKNGIVRSFNKAKNWEKVGDEWKNVVVSSLAKNAGIDELYIGTEKSGVYKLILTTTQRDGYPDIQPGEFILKQNYPNPFNPQTTIAFDLPEKSHIRLEIYNLLGQRISVLADDYFNAGRYQIIWNGKDQLCRDAASGIYFYRLITDSSIQIRKMILSR
ncbi:MAG TPA: T9SS type A sorting domain-containing protein [Candidatus Marinimicrobia bacterium]|nr:T9SS type A sorting domain-containing protein [Candidatus Neomarinimicrobiota bacterium]